ncbi:MAG TPA: GGDEF domain-containing protein [Steroidobacteraceae bacterium]|jgi:GGDEF domain-containing protein|nr:GGDEF domain-containing protein [Steroidobacteraceae bacterium]
MALSAVASTGSESAAIVRGLDLASQLRAAVLAGDDARIARLLADFIRVKGLTKGQRVRLQLRTLSAVVESLRAAALNDELSGLCNRRGFMQTGTRLLDLAARDGQRAYLTYLAIDGAHPDALHIDDVLVRQLGNFLRDLFPSYGVYEVLGRLSMTEFAALTLDPTYATRQALARAADGADARLNLPPLRIGVAPFHPARAVTVDELLQNALQDMVAHERISQIASRPRFAAQSGLTCPA